jgi:peroxin-12
MEDFSSDLNVVQPNSIGALLAEEWTIQPTSTMPSFLEMLMVQEASRSSQEALKSALEMVARWLSRLDSRPQNRPARSSLRLFLVSRQHLRRIVRKLSNFVNQYTDEIQVLTWYLLERSSLRSSASATVSEALYGMKRSKLQPFVGDDLKPQPGRRKLVDLSRSDKTKLALLLALGPYVRRKLYHVIHRRRLNDTSSSSESVWRFLLASYLPVSTALALCKLACQWKYIYGQSFSFDPSMLLLNQVVRRASQAEVDARSALAEPSSSPPPTTSSSAALDTKSQQGLKERPISSVMYLLAASVAFSWLTQMRASWDNQRHRQQSARPNAMSKIPPPPLLNRRPSNIPIDVCPLCLGKRINPVASNSGYVFCEACLRAHVRQFKNCPVTGTACNETSLVKLYEPRNE